MKSIICPDCEGDEFHPCAICYKAMTSKTADQRINRLINTITEALREMERCPNDSTQDIWNESLESWETGLRMDHLFTINPAPAESGGMKLKL